MEYAELLFKGEIPFYKMQKRYVKKNGEIVWANLTTSAICDPEGMPLYGLAMIEDITEAKRSQEEALARQKLESVGVLARGIAHDFNNLLGAILAQAEVAEADLATGVSPHEEIARIKAVAIRGAEIVRELMIYTGQDQSGVREPVDLSRLVEEMLELLKVSVSKQVSLKTSLDKNLPAVWGNASQIRQVVMNLVFNASEAIGDKEGAIQVSASRVTGAPASACTRLAPRRTAADWVRLEVSDTGCGMTEETRAKIFDPYFTTKLRGRGLGLAVVQGIIRDHGGALDVVSSPAQGATFQVFLPCTSRKPLPVQDVITSSRAEQTRARTGTILVVEDEQALRTAVSKALRKRGYLVLEAGDGSAAMDLVRTHEDGINVILLDVTLPGTSSREVFEEALRVRPSLKVIVTSAYSKESVDSSFAGLPVTSFIRKPFTLGELADVLCGVWQLQLVHDRKSRLPRTQTLNWRVNEHPGHRWWRARARDRLASCSISAHPEPLCRPWKSRHRPSCGLPASGYSGRLPGSRQEPGRGCHNRRPGGPLVAGVVDRFRAEGKAIFGPTAAAAQLEGSKSFSKDFMIRAGIPTARYTTVTDVASARRAVADFGFPVVPKQTVSPRAKVSSLPTRRRKQNPPFRPCSELVRSSKSSLAAKKSASSS